MNKYKVCVCQRAEVEIDVHETYKDENLKAYQRQIDPDASFEDMLKDLAIQAVTQGDSFLEGFGHVKQSGTYITADATGHYCNGLDIVSVEEDIEAELEVLPK